MASILVSMTTTTTTYVVHLIFVLVLAMFLSVHVTVAENPLISVICDVAEAPKTCMECMNSDPRNEQADEALLSMIVVDCATTHAEFVRGNFSSWASDIKDDQLYKEALQDCSTWFSYAKHDLFVATLGLKKGDYDGADRSVYYALMRSVACQRRRSKSARGIEVFPIMLSYELRLYSELTEAAMKIINGL